MVRERVCMVTLLVAALATAAMASDPTGTVIDLTRFGQEIDELSTPAADDELPLQEVARRFTPAARQFYISGMIGPSFAAVTSPEVPELASNGTIFNAGGAIGVAFERSRGRLRLEVEGVGRSTYDAPFLATPDPNDVTVLINNWSVMQNIWRDVMLTNRFGVYGGGGIGAGGYTLGERFVEDTVYTTPAAAFAWQAGGGLLWEMSDRLTFDVGYRYFHIDTMQQDVLVFANQFAASELMFTLRLYEPFRAWRR
ncbi:MAG: outer membrane protein [Planctomycetaceae bacterium]